MRKVAAAVAGNIWLRVGVLGALLFAVIVPFLPQYVLSALAMKATWHLGPHLIAVALGGAAGWLTYSRSVWWKTTATVSLIILFLQIGGAFLLP